MEYFIFRKITESLNIKEKFAFLIYVRKTCTIILIKSRLDLILRRTSQVIIKLLMHYLTYFQTFHNTFEHKIV